MGQFKQYLNEEILNEANLTLTEFVIKPKYLLQMLKQLAAGEPLEFDLGKKDGKVKAKLVKPTASALVKAINPKKVDIYTARPEDLTLSKLPSLIGSGSKAATWEVMPVGGNTTITVKSTQLFKGQWTGIGAEKSTGKINPTKMEVDIANEVRRAAGKTKMLPGGNENAAAQALSIKIVGDLSPKVKGNFKDAWIVSGASASANLTTDYKDFGVLSGEPKTDVIITAGAKYRCSVKKQEGAQLASAMANESRAVIQTALKDVKTSKLVDKIGGLLQTAMNKEKFYELRARFDKPTDFDRLISRVMGLSADKATPADVTTLNKALAAVGIRDKASTSIQKFMKTPKVRIAVLNEFVTGQYKFVDQDLTANQILAWSQNGTAYFKDTDKFVAKNHGVGNFLLRVSDRGKERTGIGRGGSIRLQAIKNIEVAKENINLTLNDEQQALYESYMTDFDKNYNMLIEEGVKDFVAKAKEAALKAWQTIKNFAKKVFSFIAKLFSKGTGYVMEFFNIEAELALKPSYA